MTDQTHGYDFQHQFNIYDILIYRDGWAEADKLDLKNMMMELNIYEDIFNASVTAQIFFLDMTNLVDNFPVVGGERIDIRYNTPGQKEVQTLAMVVGSVGNRVRPMSNSQYQGVILNLVTPERYKDVNLDLSMSFKGPYSQIVKSILQTLSKDRKLYSDTTLYSQTFIAPYWSPLKCCRQIAERSMGPKYEPFLFYETTDGYNFKSVLNLYTAKPYAKLFIMPGKTGNLPPEKARRKVIEYSDAKATDRIRQCFETAFGGSVTTLDTTIGRYVDGSQSYSHMAMSKDFAKVDQFPLVDNMDGNRNKSELLIARADKSHEGFQYKQSIRSLIDNYRYKVKVPGDSGYHAGQIIELDVPDVSITKYRREQTTSGRWLIGSLKHTIKRDSFYTTLELLKDSHTYDIASKVKGKPKYDPTRANTGSKPTDEPSQVSTRDQTPSSKTSDS